MFCWSKVSLLVATGQNNHDVRIWINICREKKGKEQRKNLPLTSSSYTIHVLDLMHYLVAIIFTKQSRGKAMWCVAHKVLMV